MSGMLGIIGFGSVAPISVATTPAASSTGGTVSVFTTPSLSATVTGGSGSYSYAWTIISTDGQHNFTVLSPAAAATAFRINPILGGDVCSATARLLVTDTVSGATATVDLEINHRDTRPAV